jgi:hypothetical protein
LLLLLRILLLSLLLLLFAHAFVVVAHVVAHVVAVAAASAAVAHVVVALVVAVTVLMFLLFTQAVVVEALHAITSEFRTSERSTNTTTLPTHSPLSPNPLLDHRHADPQTPPNRAAQSQRRPIRSASAFPLDDDHQTHNDRIRQLASSGGDSTTASAEDSWHKNQHHDHDHHHTRSRASGGNMRSGRSTASTSAVASPEVRCSYKM